jgi:hypothetical protein
MNLTGGGSARWAIGPRSNIDAWAVGANVEVTHSRYFDDLYITRATAALGALTLEVAW